MRPTHTDTCLIWDTNFVRCDCYWEDCLSNSHKPDCDVLAGGDSC